MNDKLDKLFQAARTVPPDTARIEFGFETRLLARLRAEPVPWFAFAWKLMPVFAAIVVGLGVWNHVTPPLDLPALLGGHGSGELLANALAGGAR